MTSRTAQRARKPNYTREETETLLDQLIMYGHFLFNKSQPVNNQQKADVWASIAVQVNAVPNSAGRTVDELKHRWQDMAQRARHALRKNPSTIDASGKTPWKPVPFLHKILRVLGESSNKDATCRQLEETAALLTAMDVAYSSDSSSAANLKEDINGSSNNNTNNDANNQDSFNIDHSQRDGTLKSNGVKGEMENLKAHTDPYSNLSVNDQSQSETSLTPNGRKRSFHESSNMTESHLPGETDIVSSLPTTLNPSPSNLCSKGINDKGDTEDRHHRFESKRRRMKKSSFPRKNVSTSSNTLVDPYQITYNTNGDDGGDGCHPVTIQHKHIETFRSMVLDPDSEIVMEMEGPAAGMVDADCGSQGSSISASNHPTAHNSHFDFNNGLSTPYGNKGGSDPLGDRYQSQFKRDEEMKQYQYEHDHPSPISNSTSKALRQSIYRNNKQLSGLPLFTAHSNNHIKNSTPQHHRLQTPDLETMSKSELDRRRLISQIQLQEQHTRYLILKEQKIQLEIDLLLDKCVYPNPPNPKTMDASMSHQTQVIPIPPSSSSSSSSSSSYVNPNHHTASTFPDTPCHISVSGVTSLKTKTNCDENEEENKNENREEGNENSIQKDGDDSSPGIFNEDSSSGVRNDDNDNNSNDASDVDDDNDGNEEHVSLLLSFGDDENTEKDCEDSSNLNEDGKDEMRACQLKAGGEDWEKNLQENIGL